MRSVCYRANSMSIRGACSCCCVRAMSCCLAGAFARSCFSSGARALVCDTSCPRDAHSFSRLSVKSCARRSLWAASVHLQTHPPILADAPTVPSSRLASFKSGEGADNGRGPIERASVEMEELQKGSAPKPAELIRLRSLSNLLEIVRAEVWTDVA